MKARYSVDKMLKLNGMCACVVVAPVRHTFFYTTNFDSTI